MPSSPMRIVITGADGFIGKNLAVRLTERGHDIMPITRGTTPADARSALASCAVVFHLAGVNRPTDPSGFIRDNRDFTAWLAETIAKGGRHPLVVFASSARAPDDSDYGSSKRAAEDALLAIGHSASVSIWRLPNIFGKWARPHYNSVVATFCHQCALGQPVRIDDPAAPLTLCYIDDLIDEWIALLDDPAPSPGFATPRTAWTLTVGELAALIEGMADDRRRGRIGPVAAGVQRALFATFMSHIPEQDFATLLSPHRDARGSFAELLRNSLCGQMSVLTAHPGVTRGGHYHHSKVERFVVVHGRARIRFRQIVSGATHEVMTSGEAPTIVETVPGWTHDITNVGDGELVTLIWANEPFDPERPDTFALPL